VDISTRKVRSDIPEHLIWRHSFAAFTSELDDPYLAVSRLEGKPPLIWGLELGTGEEGGWVVTDPDVMTEVFTDSERFSAHRPSVLANLLGVDLKLNPLDFDPPAHHGYRRVIQPLFTPKALIALEQAIRDTCQSLIAKFATKGECEFMQELAVPFPSYVFLDLMDMPKEMLPEFVKWAHQMVVVGNPEVQVAAARSIYAYFEKFLEQQRRNPTSGIVSAILAAQYEGRPLNHLEIMGMLYVLYLAGLDTVTSTVGWIMRHLAMHPELQDRLRAEPALIPAAIEEFFRAFPVARTYRTATSDMNFHGAPVRKGDKLHLSTMIAGRNSKLHPNPHVIDIERKSRHITFGIGAHTCLGMHLARREITVVVEEFVKRFKNLRIREGETYKYHTHINFAVAYLPLQWDTVR
jgi:cytochrome P450